MTGHPLLVGPVCLDLEFRFSRPKAHFGTGKNASRLKTTAPHRHASKPDVDKLVRAIGDALTGIAIRDDAQIASLSAEKVYSEFAGVTVELSEVAA
jgi:crossover junction endodeoxyribonuclease RusA